VAGFTHLRTVALAQKLQEDLSESNLQTFMPQFSRGRAYMTYRARV
jgi:hypothetical protein